MMTNSATESPLLHVDVLCFPEAMLGTVFSTMDVLRTASVILRLRNPNTSPPLTWRLLAPEDSPALFGEEPPGVFASAPAAGGGPASQRLIVIPALFVSNALELIPLASRYPSLLRMLQEHVQGGGLLAACANGLVFPAVLGLLNGCRLDTHWAFKPMFIRQFPGCDFTAEEPMGFQAPVYNCVAPALQTGFMIAILERLLDEEVGRGCAGLLQLQSQRQQLGTQPGQQEWLSLTSDSPVYRAQQYLEAHIEQPYDLAALAAVASASERTLLRHFQAVLGMTPLDYLHDLRVQRAKVMLEISLNSMQTIAQACGYLNASTLGKMFKRGTGMSPGEYRKHHTLRTKRAHWRVQPGNAPR